MLHQLSELSVRVRNAGTLPALLDVAADGLHALGFQVLFGRLEGDRVTLARAAVTPQLSASLTLHAPELAQARALLLRDLPHLGPALADRRSISIDVATVFDQLSVRHPTLSGLGASARQERVTGGVVAPIVVKDRAWGVLFVAGEKLGSAHEPALTLFASLVSSSIECIEALERLKRSSDHREAVQAMVEAPADDEPSLQTSRLLQVLCEASSSDAAALYRVNRDGKLLVLAGMTAEYPARFAEKYRSIPIEGTHSGRAAAEKSPVRLGTDDLTPDLREDATAMGCLQATVLPLLLKDQVIGTINVVRRNPTPYSNEDLSSLSMLCGQISLQLERARLQKEALRRVEELALINEVGGLISQQLDLDRVFETAMRHVCRVVDIDQAYLMVHEAGHRRLTFVASSTPLGLPTQIALDQKSLATLAFHTRQVIAIPDISADPRVSKELVEKFGHRRLLAVPLISQGKSIGVMVLGDARTRPFADGEADRAVAVANQLASAIHNARLFADLRASYEELRRTQETLVRRERLAALGELAAVVAHEVRNPLGVIFNSLSSLHRMPLGDAPLPLMRIMAEESERLNRMVSDLLDFSRPLSPDFAPARIDELVRGTLESATRAMTLPGIAIRVAIPADLPLAHIDAQLMRRAVLNLILNSVQAMPNGGELLIRASVASHSDQPVVRLEISDEGPGIPPELVDRIFQPFFTTKATGTGLGLAVVKSIVDAHHAEIAVESQPRGTTFSLLLPIARPAGVQLESANLPA